MPRFPLRTTGTVALALALLLPLSGCEHHETEGHHEETGTYPVTTPLRTDTETTREYVAQLHAIQHIEVRAMEHGYLQDVLVDEGKPVAEGESMFRIRPMLHQAEYERAAAEVEFAQIEYENTETLQVGNVVSPKELALAQARLDKARAERSLAEAHLDLTRVRAPFDGMMGRLEVRKGSLLEEGELLTTLSDNSSIWAYFNVNEAEYLAYKRRMKGHEPFSVKLRLADGSTFEQDGVVETIEADFNHETGNIAFRATFPNPDGQLRHGETGNVVVTRPLQQVLLIPQKATFDILDKKFVYVVDEEHVVHLREIEVGEELPHLYVVRGGLEEDEHILIEGLRKVRDGHEVATLLQDPNDVLDGLALAAE